MVSLPFILTLLLLIKNLLLSFSSGCRSQGTLCRKFLALNLFQDFHLFKLFGSLSFYLRNTILSFSLCGELSFVLS